MIELETVIKIEELQILINKFETCKLSYPLLPKFEILETYPEGNGYKIDVKDLDFNQFATGLEEIQPEIPNYNDLRECFLASGCLTYKNVTQFVKKYDSYKNIHKKVYFALDTNLLYHCYASSSPLRDDKVLIAPTVKEEISASMNYKFKDYQIDEFRSKISYQRNLLDELKNRRVKKSRKAAYLANNELKKINTLEVEPIDYETSDYEQNDLKIIKELKNFERETGASVVFLTVDRAMVDFCELENVDYFLFEHPEKIDVSHCTAENLRCLIYNLAVVLGFVKLNSILILGEYRGKSRPEDLKLRFLDEKIFEEFQKDLRICRRLMALDIIF